MRKYGFAAAKLPETHALLVCWRPAFRVDFPKRSLAPVLITLEEVLGRVWVRAYMSSFCAANSCRTERINLSPV